MAKRTKDTLTGGTGDVSPQYLSATFTLSAANTATEATVPLPVQRMQGPAPQKATIIEVLKIFYNLPELDATAAVETFYTARLAICTSSTTPVATLANPKSIFYAERKAHKAFTAAGTYETVYDDPRTFDCTDGAGHGILVATDNLFLQGVTVGYTAAAIFDLKIMYRWKTVSLAEYIGIVQSQQ